MIIAQNGPFPNYFVGRNLITRLLFPVFCHKLHHYSIQYKLLVASFLALIFLSNPLLL